MNAENNVLENSPVVEDPTLMADRPVGTISAEDFAKAQEALKEANVSGEVIALN